MAIHKWKKPPDAGERRRQKMEKWRQEKFLNQGKDRNEQSRQPVPEHEITERRPRRQSEVLNLPKTLPR